MHTYFSPLFVGMPHCHYYYSYYSYCVSFFLCVYVHTITSPQYFSAYKYSFSFILFYLYLYARTPRVFVCVCVRRMWIPKFIRPKWNNLIIIISGWKNKCNPIFHCGWLLFCGAHHQFRSRSPHILPCCSISFGFFVETQDTAKKNHWTRNEWEIGGNRIDWKRNTEEWEK